MAQGPSGTEIPGFGRCANCPARMTGPYELCHQCALETIPPLPERRCDICQHPTEWGQGCGNPLCDRPRFFGKCHAIGLKTGTYERALERFKYWGGSGWSMIFGRILLGHLENPQHFSDFVGYDLMIPAPSYPGEHDRDYQHVDLVVAEADRAQDGTWPFAYGDDAVIRKTQPTSSMAGTESWQEREAIARGELRRALEVTDSGALEGKRVLVIDDVFTTGHTLREISLALITYGRVAHVDGLVLMRAVFGG